MIERKEVRPTDYALSLGGYESYAILDQGETWVDLIHVADDRLSLSSIGQTLDGEWTQNDIVVSKSKLLAELGRRGVRQDVKT